MLHVIGCGVERLDEKLPMARFLLVDGCRLAVLLQEALDLSLSPHFVGLERGFRVFVLLPSRQERPRTRRRPTLMAKGRTNCGNCPLPRRAHGQDSPRVEVGRDSVAQRPGRFSLDFARVKSDGCHLVFPKGVTRFSGGVRRVGIWLPSRSRPWQLHAAPGTSAILRYRLRTLRRFGHWPCHPCTSCALRLAIEHTAARSNGSKFLLLRWGHRTISPAPP
mmetsp:Transcript_86092/g.240716  ORF Transcript_86092/g.240716 Transcript_86092/m.240716 type:complete len:220 (+) Transcript_86092:291-950(+)